MKYITHVPAQNMGVRTSCLCIPVCFCWRGADAKITNQKSERLLGKRCPSHAVSPTSPTTVEENIKWGLVVKDT